MLRLSEMFNFLSVFLTFYSMYHYVLVAENPRKLQLHIISCIFFTSKVSFCQYCNKFHKVVYFSGPSISDPTQLATTKRHDRCMCCLVGLSAGNDRSIL